MTEQMNHENELKNVQISDSFRRYTIEEVGNAFMSGFQRAHKPADRNHYQEGTLLHDAWLKGWLQANEK